MDAARWHRLMEQWGASANDDVYSQLLSAYSEPHRHYHTVRHIDDCLLQFDEASLVADEPEEVEIALWFHDAIYRPASSKNEARSAKWAVSFLQSIGAARDKSDRVYRYIMATQHAEDSQSGDAALVLDIDLSILGRRQNEFEVYEHAIREEYKWVPGPVYRRKRAELLRSFLDRPTIFQTQHFQRLYEYRARENLEWAIRRLRS